MKKFLALILLSVLAFSVAVDSLEKQTAANEVWTSYQNSLPVYSSAQQAYTQKKDTYRLSKVTSDKNAAFANAKTYLKASLNRSVFYLSFFKEKVSSMVGISEDDRSKILSPINQEIDWFTVKEPVLDASSDSRVLNDEWTTVSSRWSDVHPILKRYAGQILFSKMTHILSKANLQLTKLRAGIAAVNASGGNIATLMQMADNADSNLATAGQLLSQAKAKYLEISPTTVSASDRLYGEGAVLVNDFVSSLKEAKNSMSELRTSLRAQFLPETQTNAITGNGKITINGTASFVVNLKAPETVTLTDYVGDMLYSTPSESVVTKYTNGTVTISNCLLLQVYGKLLSFSASAGELNITNLKGNALVEATGDFKLNGETLTTKYIFTDFDKVMVKPSMGG